jgi:membrane-bound serine protease (ClpP class)
MMKKKGFIFKLMALIVVVFTLTSCGSSPRTGNVAEISIDRGIGPALAEYVDDSIQQANAAGDQFIILRVDTPGGLVASTHRILKAIHASKIPVIGFVAPKAAHAASAGTFIMYACPYAVMAPGTNMGSASPVSLTGGQKEQSDQDSVMKKKTMNYLLGKIRALAEENGRNADWAELAIKEAANVSAQEALKKNVINAIARNNSDLLKKLEGVSIKLDGKTVTLNTKKAFIYPIKPNATMQFLMIITNPNVTYVLLMIGLIGLGIEIFNPGMIFPGVIGVISLLISAYAIQLLPVNFVGLGLILLGVGFLIAEIFVSSFGALGIGGLVALTFGSMMLIRSPWSDSGVSLVTIITMVAFIAALLLLVVWLVVRDKMKPKRTGEEHLVGQEGAVQLIKDSYWVSCRGQLFKIDNIDGLQEGMMVRIERLHGARVIVSPADKKQMS